MGLDSRLYELGKDMIGLTANFLASEVGNIDKYNTKVVIINHGYGGYKDFIPEHVARVNAGRTATSLMLAYLLYSAGLDTILILSGGSTSPLAQSVGTTEAEYQKAFIERAANQSRTIEKMYDRLYSNIILEKEARNTKENVINSLQRLPGDSENIVILGVTDQQHAPRVNREISNEAYGNVDIRKKYNIVIPGAVASKWPYDLEVYTTYVHNNYTMPPNVPIILEGGSWLKLGQIVTRNFVEYRNMAKQRGIDVSVAEKEYLSGLELELRKYGERVLNKLTNTI